MKVYALLFNVGNGEGRLPTTRTPEEAVSFDANEFKSFIDMFPTLWTIYELELDEKDICAM